MPTRRPPAERQPCGLTVPLEGAGRGLAGSEASSRVKAAMAQLRLTGISTARSWQPRQRRAPPLCPVSCQEGGSAALPEPIRWGEGGKTTERRKERRREGCIVGEKEGGRRGREIHSKRGRGERRREAEGEKRKGREKGEEEW